MARKRKNSEQKQLCSSSEKLDKNGLPIQRNAANARERARMRVLSKAFSRLKTTLPWVPADTKLSKLDTLRLAACYIAHLSQILEDDKMEAPRSPDSSDSGSGGGTVHPMNLTWPFSFNSRLANSLNGKTGEVLKLQTKAEISQS